MTFPWVGHYDPGVPPEIGPVSGTLPQLLLQAALRSPRSPALAFLGRTITYGALAEQTARLAQAFRNLGVAPGSVSPFSSPTVPNW